MRQLPTPRCLAEIETVFRVQVLKQSSFESALRAEAPRTLQWLPATASPFEAAVFRHGVRWRAGTSLGEGFATCGILGSQRSLRYIRFMRQPTQVMMPIAHRSLRHLGDECLCVAQQQMQNGRAVERFLDHSRSQSITMTCDLNHRSAGRRLATHEQRDTDDALVADHSDLGGGATFHHVHQRDDCGGGEIHVA